MLPILMLAAATVSSSPGTGDERVTVEAAVASEVLYPPTDKDPWSNPGYGVTVSGSFHTESRFKAMLGLNFEHVVGGWLGDPNTPAPPQGPWAGSVADNYRGQFMRLTPAVRVGLDSDFAYGFFGFNPGYALRTAALRCEVESCRSSRALDHGLNLGLSIGALISPSRSVGLVLGAEVGLDWTWFPDGHPTLAVWTHAMSARLIVGWKF